MRGSRGSLPGMAATRPRSARFPWVLSSSLPGPGSALAPRRASGASWAPGPRQRCRRRLQGGYRAACPEPRAPRGHQPLSCLYPQSLAKRSSTPAHTRLQAGVANQFLLMAVLHHECQGALPPAALPPPFAHQKTLARAANWASNMAAGPAGQLWGCELSSRWLSSAVLSSPFPARPVLSFHSSPPTPTWLAQAYAEDMWGEGTAEGGVRTGGGILRMPVFAMDPGKRPQPRHARQPRLTASLATPDSAPKHTGRRLAGKTSQAQMLTEAPSRATARCGAPEPREQLRGPPPATLGIHPAFCPGHLELCPSAKPPHWGPASLGSPEGKAGSHRAREAQQTDTHPSHPLQALAGRACAGLGWAGLGANDRCHGPSGRAKSARKAIR